MKKIFLLSIIIPLSAFFACRAAQLPNPSISTANPPSHTLDNDYQVLGDSTADGDDLKSSVGINGDTNDNTDLHDTTFGEGDWMYKDFPGMSSDEDLDDFFGSSPMYTPGKKPAIPPVPNPKVKEPAEEKSSEDELQNTQEPPKNKPPVKNPAIPPVPKPKVEEPAEEKSSEDELQNTQEPPKNKPPVKKPAMPCIPKPKVEEPAEEKSSEDELQNTQEPPKNKPPVKKPAIPSVPKPKVEEPAEEKSSEDELQNTQEPPNNQVLRPLPVAILEKTQLLENQHAVTILSGQNPQFKGQKRLLLNDGVIEKASNAVTVVRNTLKEQIEKNSADRRKTVSMAMNQASLTSNGLLAMSQEIMVSKHSYEVRLQKLMKNFNIGLDLAGRTADQAIGIKQKYLTMEKKTFDIQLNNMENAFRVYNKQEKQRVVQEEKRLEQEEKKLSLRYMQLDKQLALEKKRFEAHLESVAKTHLEAYKKNRREQKEKEREALAVFKRKKVELENELDKAKSDQVKEKMKLELKELNEEEKERRVREALKVNAERTAARLKSALEQTECNSKKKTILLKMETEKKLEKIKIQREELVAYLKDKENEEETKQKLVRLRNENDLILSKRKMEHKRIEEEALRKSLAAANKLFQDELEYARKAAKKYTNYTINYKKPYIDKKSGKVIPGKVTWEANS